MNSCGYAGTAPITRASGKSRVVLAHARNCRLADATYQCAVAARTRLPAARQLYDPQRGPRSNPHAALRALANRLVGVLHGPCDTAPPPTKPQPGRDLPSPTTHIEEVVVGHATNVRCWTSFGGYLPGC